MNEALRSAFPGVRAVLDAPLQMQRETDRARALAGRAGEGDFESLLGAAAAAWPDGAGPAPTVRFEPGRLTLAAQGWGEPQMKQLRERLQAAGLEAEFAEGRVVVTRRKSGV
jgi:general secretion pathway protein L